MQKKSKKKSQPPECELNGEFYGVIVSRSGEVYNECAVKALLLAVTSGIPQIKQYPTKTSYLFIVNKRKKEYSAKMKRRLRDQAKYERRQAVQEAAAGTDRNR